MPGELVIGAHYDHLAGYGGVALTQPGKQPAPHLGADDNASGVAGILEIARALKSLPKLKQDVLIMAFSAEESGVLGSSHLVHEPPAGLDVKNFRAMLNLDMVGRLRENQLTVLGAKTATEWQGLVTAACERARIECSLGSDGYGPSDQTSFYAAGVPVLHFFSGSHTDYHKPSDSADKINAGGAAQIAKIVTDVAQAVTEMPGALTFQAIAPEAPKGDVRSFNASLGTIPDYAGPSDGTGILLSGVRPGSAADKAGIKRGDTLVALGKTELKSLHDFMFVLNGSKPGQNCYRARQARWQSAGAAGDVRGTRTAQRVVTYNAAAASPIRSACGRRFPEDRLAAVLYGHILEVEHVARGLADTFTAASLCAIAPRAAN